MEAIANKKLSWDLDDTVEHILEIQAAMIAATFQWVIYPTEKIKMLESKPIRMNK